MPVPAAWQHSRYCTRQCSGIKYQFRLPGNIAVTVPGATVQVNLHRERLVSLGFCPDNYHGFQYYLEPGHVGAGRHVLRFTIITRAGNETYELKAMQWYQIPAFSVHYAHLTAGPAGHKHSCCMWRNAIMQFYHDVCTGLVFIIYAHNKGDTSVCTASMPGFMQIRTPGVHK